MNKGLSDYKIKKIMDCFCVDIRASKTALFLGINRNTINRYFNQFRKKIAASLSGASGLFFGEIECDESYFGPKRIRGKRGRGSAGKTPVLTRRNRVCRDCGKLLKSQTHAHYSGKNPRGISRVYRWLEGL